MLTRNFFHACYGQHAIISHCYTGQLRRSSAGFSNNVNRSRKVHKAIGYCRIDKTLGVFRLHRSNALLLCFGRRFTFALVAGGYRIFSTGDPIRCFVIPSFALLDLEPFA